MKKFILLITVVIVTTVNISFAQVLLPTYSGDALRFSQTNYGSTSRFKALGNAHIGTGGDISSLSGNPAGLGLFTKSEFTLTPEFNSTNADANYLNNKSKTNKSQINLNQIGAVFFTPFYKQKGDNINKGLISASFGLGYNRNNDYGISADYNGVNTTSSVYNMFDGDNALTKGNNQSGNISRSGSISEFNVAGALNISNQVYVGGSIGLIDLRFMNDISLFEKGTVENYNVGYFQNQDTKGSGVNARLGIILRPINELKLGLNIQSPTWFNIDDSYVVSTDNNAIDENIYDFSYNLKTPFKGSFGASYVVMQKALISADVDFIDYSTIRFSSSNGGNLTQINQNNIEVKNNFKSAINYRLGLEIKASNLISLRGGFGLNGTPYKDDDNNIFETKFYSGGLGYRNGNYSLDLAYQKVQTNSTFSPYLLNDYKEPVAEVKNTNDNVFLTLGLRF